MSSKTPPVFEDLPTEVLRNILGQLASLEDLSSTIRASPIAFGSFRCFRATILIEVLEAHLPAEIFAEFLGLLHIPKYGDFNYVPGKRYVSRGDRPTRRKANLQFHAEPTLCSDFEACLHPAYDGPKDRLYA